MLLTSRLADFATAAKATRGRRAAVERWFEAVAVQPGGDATGANVGRPVAACARAVDAGPRPAKAESRCRDRVPTPVLRL